MATTGMIFTPEQSSNQGVLALWAADNHADSSMSPATDGLRFAFYGRVSTEDHQDPVTSKAWQLLRAQALVSGHGRVVAEFFDIGHSRSVPWTRRPDAALLLAAMADPDRGFDAIVIGSSERGFYGQQFSTMAPLFAHYGVSAWLPELGGEVDPGLTAHDELMVLLGILSKREVARARIRARTSMIVQARDHGRYLGGRPPYGYRLVDAGPHPKKAEARRGVRLHKLGVDPTTGPVVSWMFAQRLAGHSKARITRALNDAAIPSPGTSDPERNPHRRDTRWTLTAVRAILANPRYTGREVWNWQRTDHVLVDPENTTLGERDVMRWNSREDWVISERPAHPALVSEEDFVRTQGIRATVQAPGRVYRPAGRLVCGMCGRRMESCWANDKPAYRCRHGFSSAAAPDPARPKNAYVREELVLQHLPTLHLRLCRDSEDAGADTALAYLQVHAIKLIYDPTARTVTADTEGKERVHLG